MGRKLAAVEQEDKKIELSCRESQLLLKVIPMEKELSGGSPEEKAAAGHYIGCDPCQRKGLHEITGTKLSCQEAILVWAKSNRALFLSGRDDIKTQLAKEHVWGRWVKRTDDHGFDSSFERCQNKPCEKLFIYWQRVPMSSHYDGGSGVIHLLPAVLEIFREQKWSLNEILKIQRERISLVIEHLAKRKIPPPGGHYNDLYEPQVEVNANVKALQELILDRPLP
jgi:hypothetical protein